MRLAEHLALRSNIFFIAERERKGDSKQFSIGTLKPVISTDTAQYITDDESLKKLSASRILTGWCPGPQEAYDRYRDLQGIDDPITNDSLDKLFDENPGSYLAANTRGGQNIVQVGWAQNMIDELYLDKKPYEKRTSDVAEPLTEFLSKLRF